MRLAHGPMVAMLATTFLTLSSAHAQGFVPPSGGNPTLKQLFDAYDKLLKDPAYDFLEMKNTEGEIIRSARFGGASEKAIALGERRLALARSRGLYGHLASTWIINDLAEAYRAAGKHDKLVALNKEFADWCVAEYGPRNPETRMALTRLVQSHLDASQEDKAQALANEILAREKSPEETHLQILGMFQNHHLRKKEYEKVLKIAQKIMRIHAERKQADPGSPFAPYRQQIAYTLIQADRKDLAEKLIDDNWESTIKDKGPEAPETIAALRRNAGDYLALGLADKAVARFEQLDRLLTKSVGRDHADTLTARQQLASAYLLRKETDKGLALLKELHATTKEKLGLEHPLTGQLVLNLSTLMETAKKYDQAEIYLRESLEIQKKISKADDTPAVTTSMALLGMNLIQQEKWAEAEKVLRQTLEIRRKKAPRDWTTNNTESLLGGVLVSQKKYEEAEPLLLAGYKGLLEKRFYIPYQVQTQRINEAVERLIRLYEATEKPAKVEEYRKLLLKR